MKTALYPRISLLMHKPLILIFVLFLSYVPILNIHEAHSHDHGKTLALILESAEKFFISLNEGKYETAWDLLSEKSHKIIIDDVYKASRKIEDKIKKEDIIKDFKSRGVIFNNYWNAFVNSLDAGMILKQSRWEMGFVKNDKAEIIISHKKAKQPARLRMFREDNAWRVGLVETFWTRKYW